MKVRVGVLMKRLLLCIIFCVSCSNSRGVDIATANGGNHADGLKKNGQDWAKENNFPPEWWAQPEGEVPDWEVGHTPDTAGPGEVILSKRTALGILSNLARTPFLYRGKKYESVEGLWQSTKYPETDNDERWAESQWPFKRAQVEDMWGFEAKNAGKPADEILKRLHINWITFEGTKMTYHESGESPFYRLIRDVMIAKLVHNFEVRQILLKTRNLKLFPDHKVNPDKGKAWQYHQIWMELREKARNGEI